MASNIPGSYFTINNNLDYTEEVVTTSNTCVALVGYATKGEIGVPTQITSWSNFKKIFGSPIEDSLTALTVRKVLTAGGSVLFTRIADTTLASTSKVVVKNGSSAYNGYALFSQDEDVLSGTSGYTHGDIYTMKITDNDVSKNVYIRAPSSGRFSISDIYSQISDALDATPGEYELAVDETATEGFYGFNIAYSTDGSSYTNINSSPFFVKLTSGEGAEAIANALIAACQDGSNGYCKVYLGSQSYDEGSSGGSSTSITSSSMASKLTSGNTYSFGLYIGSGSEQIVTVTISGSGTDTSGATVVTYNDIATALNTMLTKNYGVKCYFVPSDGTSDAYFVFVNESYGQAVKVTSVSTSSVRSNELFALQFNDSTNAAYESFVYYNGDNAKSEESFNSASMLFVNKSSVVSSGEDAYSETSIYNIEYNSSTKSIVVSTLEEGEGNAIKLVDPEFGKSLITDAGLGTIITARPGEDAMEDVTVEKTDDSQIKIIGSSLDAPTIEEADISGDYYADIGDILGDVTTYEGSLKVEDSTRDIVVFEAKEYGSDTTNISITVGTTSDDNAYRYFDVYVDSVLKEEFMQGTDFDYMTTGDDTSFDTVINESSNNGGSDYIKITVKKNRTGTGYEEVELQDGTYTLGASYTVNDIEHSTAKTSSMSDTAWTEFDYEIGDDGIADTDDDLYEELFDVDDGVLSNVNLYKFCILATPDNLNDDVQTAAIELCEERQDCGYLVDPPDGLTVDQVIAWHNGKNGGTKRNSSNAAIYYPWIQIYNSITSKYQWVPPSVELAALMVATDEAKGPWQAPAGEKYGVTSATDVRVKISPKDNKKMYLDSNRVNPIIKFDTGNIVVNGEKNTFRESSAYAKVHVNRLVFELQQKLRTNSRPYIFEDTNSDKIADIKSVAETILSKYKEDGAITSYTIVCDSTNNTSESLQQDVVYCSIAIVPVGTIEVIKFTIDLNKE